MTTTNRKILQALLITDGLLIFVCAAFFGMETLLNTQVGFFSATLVMLASMKSYKRMVDARVEHEIVTMDIDKDVIDKLEDPHDLYSEKVKEEPVEDVRAAIKEEKARMKASKRSLFEILKETKAALSVYRIGAYVLLVLGFLYLNRHGMLQLPAYLLSLGLPPLLVVWALLRNKPSDRKDAVE